MPVFDEIVVSMSNMNTVRSFDNVSGRHYSPLFFFSRVVMQLMLAKRADSIAVLLGNV